MSRDKRLPAAEFLAPLPILATILTGVNDHLLKGSDLLPRALTGKISDFCGLFFFPLLVSALVRTAASMIGQRPTTGPLRLALLGTAGAFTLLKLSQPLADLVAAILPGNSRILADPTDLAALVVLPLAWLYGRRRIAGS